MPSLGNSLQLFLLFSHFLLIWGIEPYCGALPFLPFFFLIFVCFRYRFIVKLERVTIFFKGSSVCWGCPVKNFLVSMERMASMANIVNTASMASMASMASKASIAIMATKASSLQVVCKWFASCLQVVCKWFASGLQVVCK